MTLVLTHAIAASDPGQTPPACDVTQISLEEATGMVQANWKLSPGLTLLDCRNRTRQSPGTAGLPDSGLIDRMLGQRRVLGKTTWHI